MSMIDRSALGDVFHVWPRALLQREVICFLRPPDSLESSSD
jgi:hypothetical protein